MFSSIRPAAGGLRLCLSAFALLSLSLSAVVGTAGCTGEKLIGQDLPGEFALLLNPNDPNSRFRFASTQFGSVPGPSRFDVYFTQPGTTNTNGLDPILDDALVSLIGGAQNTIDIAIFELDRQNVVTALLSARSRGVNVRMVGDEDNAGESGYTQLAAEGVPMRNRPPGSTFMHNKFVVVDGRYVWTGSTNLTDSNVLRNNDNALIIESTTMAAAYTAEFNEMFTGQRFGGSKNDVLTSNTTTVNGALVEYYMGPKEALLNQLLARLGTADVSVHFMVFAFTRDDLREALIAKKNAGVKVMGVFDQLQAGGPYAEDVAIASAGIPSWIDGNNNSIGNGGGILHHKVMIIDGNSTSDPMVITGSTNWTEAADSENDENMVIIHSRDLARLYLQEFCAVVGVASVHPAYAGSTDSGCGGKSMINEVMANPSGTDTGNEYVEIANTGIGSVNMSGWQLRVGGATKHVFTSGYVLPPSSVAVVYDSGSHAGVPGALNASGGSLGLVNSGGTVELRNPDGVLMDTFTYGSTTDGVSHNRNPDASADGGSVAKHNTVTGASGNSSPGRRADQSAFAGTGGTTGPVIPAPEAGELVLSQFATRGSSSASDEFVEIYNRTDHAIDISGITLQYQSSTCGGWSVRATIQPGVHLEAGQFFLFVNSGGYASPASGPVGDGTYSAGLADNGFVRLVSVGGGELDRVGFGAGLSCSGEGGTNAANHGTGANGLSVQRKPGGYTNAYPAQDSNNNGSDFQVSSGRAPRNMASPVEASSGSQTPLPGELIVTQLTSRGSSDAYDEFVEIYNNSRKTLTIDGVVVQYRTSSCGSWSDRLTISGGITLAPGRFYLAANTRGYLSPASGVAPDGVMTTSGFADAGSVRLVNATATQLDLVAFGTSTGCTGEGGTFAPQHNGTPGGSVARHPWSEGTNFSLLTPVFDTGNNASDFAIRTSRQARNRASMARPSH